MEPLPDDIRDRVDAIFTTQRRYVEAIARANCHHPQDVPDIVQQVGLNLCKAIGAFRGESQIHTWLHRVTVNAARDFYRKGQRLERKHDRFRTLTRPELEVAEDPETIYARRQRSSTLSDAIARLRPVSRAALCNNLRGARVSSSSEGNEVTGRVRLTRARHELRVMIANHTRSEGHNPGYGTVGHGTNGGGDHSAADSDRRADETRAAGGNRRNRSRRPPASRPDA